MEGGARFESFDYGVKKKKKQLAHSGICWPLDNLVGIETRGARWGLFKLVVINFTRTKVLREMEWWVYASSDFVNTACTQLNRLKK